MQINVPCKKKLTINVVYVYRYVYVKSALDKYFNLIFRKKGKTKTRTEQNKTDRAMLKNKVNFRERKMYKFLLEKY